MSDTERFGGLSAPEINRMIEKGHKERMKELEEIKADLIKESGLEAEQLRAKFSTKPSENPKTDWCETLAVKRQSLEKPIARL